LPHVDLRIEADASEHLRQASITVRPRDDVKVCGLFVKRAAAMLRHASE
jgi:hypothetical protein